MGSGLGTFPVTSFTFTFYKVSLFLYLTHSTIVPYFVDLNGKVGHLHLQDFIISLKYYTTVQAKNNEVILSFQTNKGSFYPCTKTENH